MRRIVVEVTEEDIRLGLRGKPSACPIARAFLRAGSFVGVHVACGWMDCSDHLGDVLSGEMPEPAATFIFNFDRGASVAPFSFTLDLK